MEDLRSIFDQLKPLLAVYHPPLQPKTDDGRCYDLWSIKELVIDGRKHKEIFFAAIILQSSYVSFHFMPVYAEPKIKELLKPELLARLKGKSCFHSKKLDSALVEQITDALAMGFKKYQERGWVS